MTPSDYYKTSKMEVIVPLEGPGSSPKMSKNMFGGSSTSLGLKGKVHALQRSTKLSGATIGTQKMRDTSKNSMKQKSSYTSLNSSGGGSKKFGQPKNSVKPPTKKSSLLPTQY